MALTADQMKFLAQRLLAKSDRDAAIAAGIHPKTPGNWKQEDPEFVERYNAIFEDGIQLAKDIVRQHLGKAGLVIAEALDARYEAEPDWKARLKAVELAFKTHGLLQDRTKLEGDPDNPIKQIIEVVRIGGSSKADTGTSAGTTPETTADH